MFGKKVIPSKPFTYSPKHPAPVRGAGNLTPEFEARQTTGQKLLTHYRVKNGLGRYCGIDKAI